MRRGMARVGVAAALLAAMWGCDTGPSAPTPVDNTIDPATPAYYTHNVKPIFQKYCYRCHAGLNHRGGLTMATRAGLMKGGETGKDIVPGDPQASVMMRLIRHEPGPAKGPGPMPSKSSKLADQDIDTVGRWIAAGAVMPQDGPVP